MKVSLSIVKQFTQVDLPIDELVAKINAQLGSVDDVIDLGDVYKDAVIVKVVECEKHPDADRLNVTRIDDGGAVQDVERDENGLVQVVCGAPNVHADMFAVWLPPKSVVPASYHDGEPFVLGARELRGVMSQGMLAAADELGIGSDHAGILEIDPTEWHPSDETIKPGASFAKIYGLDDTIIDIENKMFTHRPDLFGQLGVAREIAGILGEEFKSPSWYVEQPQFASAEGLELAVSNDAGENVPRFMAVAMKDVTIAPSPVWLQCALVAMGSKPINNIVDVTNYVMLLTAQPTHAYDYDKIRGHKLGVRMAQDGETIELLNGKTYELTADDIVIADAEGPIGLGGIMGGGKSEVSADTTNIILEVGTFDMYTVRKSSMRHGVFTDAVTRFNKGQSALQNDHILQLLMTSIKDVSEAEQATRVHDHTEHADAQYSAAISVKKEFINARLGLDLENTQIAELLRNVEIQVDTQDDSITITPPFWRTDLELPEDIVEEVGRLYGFDALQNELPQRPLLPPVTNDAIEQKAAIRSTLSKLGANEVLTYSFVHEHIFTKAAQDPACAYQISNALSPDLQYYRTSVVPSLLDKVHMNIKSRYDQFALFEFGNVHFKGEMDDDEPSVPNEDSHLGFVVAHQSKSAAGGSAYYRAKRYLEAVINTKIDSLTPLSGFDLRTDTWGAQLVGPYEPARSAVIVRDGQIWGVVGEYKAAVRTAFKLPEQTAGFEINAALLTTQRRGYRALPRFPSVTQDLTIEVPYETPAQAIADAATQTLSSLDESWATSLEIVSIYQADGGDVKSITLRFVVANHERSLTDTEVASLLETVHSAATRLPQ